jgi:hypothetical protein
LLWYIYNGMVHMMYEHTPIINIRKMRTVSRDFNMIFSQDNL